MEIDEVGSWIRSERKAQGIKLVEICKQCGLDASTFSYIENNRNFPRLENLSNILEVLGYEIEFVKKEVRNVI